MPDRDPHAPSRNESATRPRAGFLATLRAVLWSFVGIRRRHDYESDVHSLDPRAVIAAGLLAGLVFVLTIIAVVRLVIGSSG
ncbi:DUF2970 domain-containing protein [Azoarcus sp. DN11]|uniref:DUF2970 domain-containing protein n=1 Tax=Azoarcus sp. DN11 TaxID=356837 RepID=UPI000EADEC5F|nr:DUF2970 domain-containing protein [Azoarcus sp. DN11]AYH45207.1 hypothetical protein CDA09_17800 [Azoarcus sp. DN11]